MTSVATHLAPAALGASAAELAEALPEPSVAEAAPLSARPSARIAGPASVPALQASTITGSVFHDLNANSTQDPTEPFLLYVSGVTVTAYDASNAQVGQTTVVSATGQYSLSATGTGPFRLEFTGLPTWLEQGVAGSGSGTTVRFANDGDTVNLAVQVPAEFCESTPDLATSCYVNGNPNAASGPYDVLVSWPYARTGDVLVGGWVSPNRLAAKSDIGSVWGLAYSREHETLYSAAHLKRHVGLNERDPQTNVLLSNPLGAIYATNVNGAANNRLFIDLSTQAIAVGTIANNVTRGVNGGPTSSSTDATAFPKIGKVGIGDIDLSADESTLYAVSLGSKELVSIVVNADGTAGAVSAVAIPDPGCTGGQHRPYGLKVYRGDVYVGVVCDGSSGGTGDLTATVYRWSGGTSFTSILTFALNYPKGHTSTLTLACEARTGWFTWSDTWPARCRRANAGGGQNLDSYSRPSPILADIEFDIDGSLILGFNDRFGHQIGTRNNNLVNGAL